MSVDNCWDNTAERLKSLTDIDVREFEFDSGFSEIEVGLFCEGEWVESFPLSVATWANCCTRCGDVAWCSEEWIMGETSADELRELIARLGLSQRACARALEVPISDFRRMCSGQHEIPNAIVLALKQLIREAQP